MAMNAPQRVALPKCDCLRTATVPGALRLPGLREL